MLRPRRQDPRPPANRRTAAPILAAVLLFSPGVARAGENKPDLDPIQPSLARESVAADLPEEVRLLVARLYSSDQNVIAAAAEALGAMGPEAVSAAPVLASLLDGHWAQPGPNSAAAALVRIGKGAFDAAAAAAASTGGEARRRALLVMVRLDGPRTIPVAVDLLASGTGGDFCLGALRTVGEPARHYVFRAAASDDPARRLGAVRAAPAFSSVGLRYRDLAGHGGGDRPQAAGYRTQAVVDLLLGAVADGDAGVQGAALESLARVAPCPDKKMPLADGLRAALAAPDPATRRAAISVTLATDETETVRFDALAPLTGDGDSAVRTAAVAALGNLSGERARAAPRLLDLLRDPEAGIREGAALALGNLRAAEAEAALLAALGDPARPVRIAAARSLGAVAGQEGARALAALAKGPADPAVRLQAVESLAHIYAGLCGKTRRGGGRHADGGPFRPEDAQASEAIFQVLSQVLADPLTDLHETAIRALVQTPAAAGKDLVPLLLLALQSPDEHVRVSVVRQFLAGSRIRDDRILEAVHRRVLSWKISAGELEYSCGLLARWGDGRSLPVFKEVLLSGRTKSSQAISGLVAAGGESLDFVLANLGSPNPRVRGNVASVLARHMDNPKVGGFLRAAVSSPDEDLRAGARQAIAEVPESARTFDPPDKRLRAAILAGTDALRSHLRREHPSDILQAAKALLADGDGSIRAAAAAVLAETGDPSAAPALRQALADESAPVRAGAIEALAVLGDRPAADAILAAMEDPHEAVREAAASALGRLADPAALGPLVQAMDDPDGGLRRAAAQALGALADPRAAEALTKALAADPHWAVRAAAATALGRRKEPKAVPTLLAALADGHWYVRRAAHGALMTVTGQDLPADEAAWRAWWAGRAGTDAPQGRQVGLKPGR